MRAPVLEELDMIQQYMAGKIGIGALIDLEKFVDTRFAEEACKGGPQTILLDTTGSFRPKRSRTWHGRLSFKCPKEMSSRPKGEI